MNRNFYMLLLFLFLCSTTGYAQTNQIFVDTPVIIKETDIEFIFVQGGSFIMGSNEFEEEKPAHKVSVNSFYMSRYKITQKIWQIVMGYNESYFKGCDNCPVENVSWYDIQEFISKLSKMAGKRYRLPTEAEWEFTAKGGNISKHYKYIGSNYPDSIAWYYDPHVSSPLITHPVGQKKPNELGFYDMAGNVMEWCFDWWKYNYYSQSPINNPQGPSSGTQKVVRGGSISDPASNCTPTGRSLYGEPPDGISKFIGFRLARDCQ